MKKFTPFTLVALLAATPVFAFPGGERPSEEEIAAARAELFTAADADGDSALGIAEFTTFTELAHAERVEHQFNHLDQDGDGLVSAEEFESGDHRRPRRGGQ